MDVANIVQHSGLPQSAVYKAGLYGVVNETIAAASDQVLKHKTDPTKPPNSDMWVIGSTPMLSFALVVEHDCTLRVEWSNDGVNFYDLNPILLAQGPNDLSGRKIPGLQVRFTVRNVQVAATCDIDGFIKMEAE